MAPLYLVRGRLREALSAAQESVSLTERSDRRAQRAFATLGDAQVASRNLAAAISAYEESLKVQPALFGVTYEVVNQWAEAEMEERGFARGYSRAMARAARDDEAINLAGMVLVKMGEAYRLSGNSTKAIEIFDGVEKQTPPYSDDILGLARCSKGRVLLANRDLEGASKAYLVDEALLKTTNDLTVPNDLTVQSEVILYASL